MKVSAVLAVGGSLLVAGCATSPEAPAPRSVTPTAPVAAQAPKPVVAAPVAPKPAAEAPKPAEPEAAPARVAETTPPPPLSPAAAAVVDRLTQTYTSETQRHQISDISSFPEAQQSLQPGARAPRYERISRDGQPPASGLTADGTTTQLVERDWTGLVLVPISTAISKLHTSDVRLTQVEAHPLEDGRVRVWARVHNIGTGQLPAEIACSFRMRGAPAATSPYFYGLQVPGRSFRDVFFISPDGDMNGYTMLVRGAISTRK